MLIYTITNKVNGKVYVGKTARKTPERRWYEHRRDSKYNFDYPLYRAFRKYGFDKFQFQVIAVAFTREGLTFMERQVIRQFDSVNREVGYNLTEGGEGGYVSDETRRKMSIAQSGNKKNLGKVASEQKRRLIGEANRRRAWATESKQKIGDSNRGKQIFQTPEFREKMRQLYLQRKVDEKGRILPC